MGDLKNRNLHVKRVELSAKDFLEISDKATLTVVSPSRITTKERKILEEKLLDFAEKKGSISRAEAVDLCRIKSDQAYRLLQQLVKKGKLRKVGGEEWDVPFSMN